MNFPDDKKIVMVKKKELNLNDIQDALYDLLIAFADFCEEHGLRYYLSGGTMLGAIRHKGFIPWDDDIDINMPRPDYDKLCKIANGNIGKYTLWIDKRLYLNYVRLSDPNIFIHMKYEGLFFEKKKDLITNLYIDICPLDGLPENKYLFRLECILMSLLMGMQGVLYHGFVGKTLMKKIIRIPLYPFAKAFGKERLSKWSDKLARHIDFSSADHIGAILTFNRFKDYLPKKEYLEQIKVDFRDRKFFTTAMYKEHLRLLYGEDYMKLPPENKRTGMHTFHAWIEDIRS